MNKDCFSSNSDEKKLIQRQMAFMLARQQVYLELDENMDDYDELVEIMSNAHLNNNFLSLAREVMHSLQLYLNFCWKFSNIQRGFK